MYILYQITVYQSQSQHEMRWQLLIVLIAYIHTRSEIFINFINKLWKRNEITHDMNKPDSVLLNESVFISSND